VKVIALLPVKNEAWVLEHTLACLSGFCDVVLVSDQRSEDRSREIGRQFPKVVWIESSESQISTQARWQLWDAARQYDGTNILWCTDADELVSPRLAGRFLEQHKARLVAGTVIDCLYSHFWDGPTRYRTGLGSYAPYWKPVAIVDDRRVNYDRSRTLSIHEERVPLGPDSPRVRADGVPVLHLQWLLPNRSQIRQAWYRCHEWMHAGSSAATINHSYSVTLPTRHVPTAPIPHDWLDGVTLPDTAIDAAPSWAEADILGWFNERGVEFFEPLEIWHIARLRDEFRRRVGRNPRPDRSYLAPWPVRAQWLGRRVLHAAKRRLIP
jgi:hypothetical protein